MSFQLPVRQCQTSSASDPEPLVVALTLGASIHAERAVCQLDLGRAVPEVPLLLGLVVEGFSVKM
jgi:hypothetical protein